MCRQHGYVHGVDKGRIRQYEEPFTVLERIENVAYKVQLSKVPSQVYPVFHINLLKPFYKDPHDPERVNKGACKCWGRIQQGCRGDSSRPYCPEKRSKKYRGHKNPLLTYSLKIHTLAIATRVIHVWVFQSLKTLGSSFLVTCLNDGLWKWHFNQHDFICA